MAVAERAFTVAHMFLDLQDMHLEMEEWVVRMHKDTLAPARSHTQSVLLAIWRLPSLLRDDMQPTIATDRLLTALHASAERFAPQSEDCLRPLMVSWQSEWAEMSMCFDRALPQCGLCAAQWSSPQSRMLPGHLQTAVRRCQ